MTNRLLFQGLGEATFAQAVGELLAWPEATSFTLSSGHVTEGGVGAIREWLAPVAHRTTAICGIRTGHTTRAGIEALLGLGVKVVLVDTRPGGYIYHPKFYLAQHTSGAKLLLGSGNLTRPGMNHNFELGVLLEENPPGDGSVVGQLKRSIQDLIELGPPLVQSVSNTEQLDALERAGAFAIPQS